MTLADETRRRGQARGLLADQMREEMREDQAAQTQVNVTRWLKLLWGFLFGVICLFPWKAHATPEAICPTGASPRSDIVWCIDFEEYGNAACTTGQEAGCATANGLTALTVSAADTKGFKIKNCSSAPIGGAANGNGCIYGSGRYGSTGPGYANHTISPTITSVSYRWAVKFTNGYIQNHSNTGAHGPGIIWSDGASCIGQGFLDFTMAGVRVLMEENGGCGSANWPTDSFELNANLGDWVPKDNIWYAVEYRMIMNTLATTAASDSGNGTVQLYVGELNDVSLTKILEYTNVNIRGLSVTAKFADTYGARSYVGLGVPKWEPNIAFDSFALSNDGTLIGPPVGENSEGTADSSGYWYAVAGNAAAGSKLSSDCSTPGPGTSTQYVTNGWEQEWGVGMSLSSTVNHETYTCDAGAACGSCDSRSMKVTTTGTNQRAGVEYLPVDFLRTTYIDRFVSHGWIYLPSSNTYGTAYPWVGFARYDGVSNTGDWLGLCRSSGNWALCQGFERSAQTVQATATAATTNTWHEYEMHVTDANKCSLYIDGTWLIDEADCSTAVSTWLYDQDSAGDIHMIVGVVDYSQSGTFDLYYDDWDVGGQSFVSSKGWADASNPFASGSVSTGATSGGACRIVNKRRRKR